MCHFKDKICNHCGKSGHIAKACFGKSSIASQGTTSKPRRSQRTRTKKVNQVEEESEGDSENADIATVDSVEGKGEHVAPITVCVTLDSTHVSMEVDTGASVSIMSENVYKQLWPGRSLDTIQMSIIKLKTYLHEPIGVVGSTMVQVQYQGQAANLHAHISLCNTTCVFLHAQKSPHIIYTIVRIGKIFYY